MASLEIATKALISLGAKPVMDKIRRRREVLTLLKRVGISPRTPSGDFDTVYTYALVEHCYGKSPAVTQFFQNEAIRGAFHVAFRTGDLNHLRREASHVIDWNEETGNLGTTDYDYRREFASFTAIFNTLVERTQTVAEVKAERKVGAMHDDLTVQLSELRNRLEELPTLAEIRDLADKSAEAKPVGPAAALAAELRDWFNAIGYRFESYDVSAGETFTWIINVPARKRYERVVILGRSGEVTTLDVHAANDLVSHHNADEAWVVSPRRISDAARLAASSATNTIECFILDELIDQEADFEPYLDWLDRDIHRRHIDTNYIQTSCSKQEFDPHSGRVLATSYYEDDRGGVDGYVRSWLADPSKEHLSVLGEFGTGKTWFCLHFAWKLAQDYKEAKRDGLPRPRIPLVIPLRDYAKAVSIESLFSEFFFRKHEIPLSGYSVFEHLNRSGRLLLIFDGFDEMAARVNKQQMINNFWKLARAVVPGAKVLLTCRTEHFPEARDSRDLLSAGLRASTDVLTGASPQFEVIDLLPFNNQKVELLLSRLTDAPTTAVVMQNPDLLDLMRRPVISELIVDALPNIAAGGRVDISRIYLYQRETVLADSQDIPM